VSHDSGPHETGSQPCLGRQLVPDPRRPRTGLGRIVPTPRTDRSTGACDAGRGDGLPLPPRPQRPHRPTHWCAGLGDVAPGVGRQCGPVTT